MIILEIAFGMVLSVIILLFMLAVLDHYGKKNK
jgi:hypothetical protein